DGLQAGLRDGAAAGAVEGQVGRAGAAIRQGVTGLRRRRAAVDVDGRRGRRGDVEAVGDLVAVDVQRLQVAVVVDALQAGHGRGRGDDEGVGGGGTVDRRAVVVGRAAVGDGRAAGDAAERDRVRVVELAAVERDGAGEVADDEDVERAAAVQGLE